MNKPAISVIIPLYNKEAIIRRSVESVLSQSFGNFELIIVNDGSTDNSAEVVKTIDDDRIIYLEQKNGGPSAARNAGAKKATADWIVFLDADDELIPDALKTMFMHIQSHHEVDLVDFNRYVGKGNKRIAQYHPINGYITNPMRAWYYRLISPGCGHTIYRTSLIEKFPYDTRMRRYEDAEFLIRMLPHAKVYSSSEFTEMHNADTAAASHARKDVKEDYFGYLDFHGKNFWQKMCMYALFLSERDYYPVDGRKLYPTLYYRLDYYILYKLLPFLKKIFYRNLSL